MLTEDDRFVFVYQNFAFDVLLDGTREDDLFEIFPLIDQISDGVFVGDSDDLLLDDRSGIQLGRYVMARGPDDLDTPFECSVVRFGSEWWMLMMRFG